VKATAISSFATWNLNLDAKSVDAFENAHVDAVIINAAGCGSNVKEYGHLPMASIDACQANP
jgi:hypothetical protein